jgi:hypothetical protein
VAVLLLLALRSLPLVLSLLLMLLGPSTGSIGGIDRGRLTSGTTAAAPVAAAAGEEPLVLLLDAPTPGLLLLGPSAAAVWEQLLLLLLLLLLRPAVAPMVLLRIAARVSVWLPLAPLLSSQLLLLVADLAVVDASTAAGVPGSAAD